jgi:hypothetical protein
MGTFGVSLVAFNLQERIGGTLWFNSKGGTYGRS